RVRSGGGGCEVQAEAASARSSAMGRRGMRCFPGVRVTGKDSDFVRAVHVGAIWCAKIKGRPLHPRRGSFPRNAGETTAEMLRFAETRAVLSPAQRGKVGRRPGRGQPGAAMNSNHARIRSKPIFVGGTSVPIGPGESPSH